MSRRVDDSSRGPRVQRLAREHFKAAVFVISTVATILGGLGWAVPSLRGDLAELPGLAWSLALVFGTCWIVSILASTKRKDEVTALKGQLAEASRRVQGPSEGDLDLYNWLINLLPLERGLVGRLVNAGFSFKRWTSDDLRPLEDLEAAREEYFDNVTAEAARQELFEACRRFNAWLSREGAPTSREGDRLVYTIMTGHEREKLDVGGWAAYDKALREAEDLAWAVVEKRREFERRCREQGLYRRGRSMVLG